MPLNKQRLEGLHPELIQPGLQAIAWFKQQTGVTPTVTSVYRTHAEQLRLYEARATNRYPVEPPGNSAHGVTVNGRPAALAFDSSVPAQWMPYWVAVRRAIGFTVPDNDLVHSAYPNWRAVVAQGSPWSA